MLWLLTCTIGPAALNVIIEMINQIIIELITFLPYHLLLFSFNCFVKNIKKKWRKKEWNISVVEEFTFLASPDRSDVSYLLLRDAEHLQNGWTFGKVPNSLIFGKLFCGFRDNIVTKVRMFIMAGLLCIIWSYFPWDACSTTVQHGN